MDNHKKSESRLISRDVAIESFSKDVLKEMAYNNPELYEFFKELHRYSEVVSAEFVSEHLKRADECQKMLQRSAAQTEKIGRHLKKMGVELSAPYYFSADRNGEYAESEGNHFVEYHEFNGCRIKKEMLTNPNDQTLRDLYEGYKKYNLNFDKEVEYLTEEIKEKERRLKFTFSRFKRAKLQEDIESARSRLEILKEDKEREQHAKRELEAFESLKPEQKREILRYLEARDAINEARKLVVAHEKEASKARTARYSEAIMTESFKRLKKDKDYTDQDISRIFDMIKTIKKKRDKGEYRSRTATRKDYEVSKYKDVIAGFLKYVYDGKESLITGDVFGER